MSAVDTVASTTSTAGATGIAGRRAGPDASFRPEVQGLRAVAVLLVVAFHLYPNRVPGGYVGVDVFFVISGFLITSHINRELVSTGTVRLRRFWARRIRRLLPASLLVLAVSAVAVLAFLPATLWSQSARQIGASALYVQNWALASDAVDYMAADNVPTVAQHYWSLSVEEQFYLVWPLLILGLALLHRRSGAAVAARRAWVVGGLAVLAGASLAYSVLATYRDQSQAYFVTPTRVWEFAAGAMLALLVGTTWRPAWWRGPLAWAGIAAVVAAGLAFDGATLFPGWVALLPVLGTVAVILAGGTRGWATPAPWLSLRPMTFIGDISYSIYLWHWPLIVVLPYVTGTDLRTVDKVAIAGATVLLAWLSKTLVEDPGRTRPLLAAAPWRSFAFAAVGMAVVVGGAVVVQAEVDRRAEASAERLAALEASGCIGPGALDPANDCGPPQGTGDLVPAPEVVARQNTDVAYPGCQAGITSTGVTECSLGVPAERAERVVAVVGDSHATHWFPAIDQLGTERGWQVLTFTKSSCPFTAAERTLESEQTDDAVRACRAWGDEVLDRLLAADVSYVFTASYSTAYDWRPAPGDDLADPGPDGFATMWSRLTDEGVEVFPIADVPRTQGENVPNCLAANDDRMACAMPRAEALPGSVVVTAAERADDERVHLIDLTDQFCDAQSCYPVVGDMIVYRDYSHVAADYARALVPYIEARLDEVGLD